MKTSQCHVVSVWPCSPRRSSCSGLRGAKWHSNSTPLVTSELCSWLPCGVHGVCRNPGSVAPSWLPQRQTVGALLPQCSTPIACWRGSCSGSAKKLPHSKLRLPSTSGGTHVFKVEGCSHLLRNAFDSILFVIKLREVVDEIDSGCGYVPFRQI